MIYVDLLAGRTGRSCEEVLRPLKKEAEPCPVQPPTLSTESSRPLKAGTISVLGGVLLVAIATLKVSLFR